MSPKMFNDTFLCGQLLVFSTLICGVTADATITMHADCQLNAGFIQRWTTNGRVFGLSPGRPSCKLLSSSGQLGIKPSGNMATEHRKGV